MKSIGDSSVPVAMVRWCSYGDNSIQSCAFRALAKVERTYHLLDTGSSTLAFCKKKYMPEAAERFEDYYQCNQYGAFYPQGHGYYGPVYTGIVSMSQMKTTKPVQFDLIEKQVIEKGNACGRLQRGSSIMGFVGGIMGLAFGSLGENTLFHQASMNFTAWETAEPGNCCICPSTGTFFPSAFSTAILESSSFHGFSLSWENHIYAKDAGILSFGEDAENKIDPNMPSIAAKTDFSSNIMGFSINGQYIEYRFGTFLFDTGTPDSSIGGSPSPYQYPAELCSGMKANSTNEILIFLQNADVNGDPVPLNFTILLDENDISACKSNTQPVDPSSAQLIAGLDIMYLYKTVIWYQNGEAQSVEESLKNSAAVAMQFHKR